MTDSVFTVTKNIPLAVNTWEMELAGDVAGQIRPGQFVNVLLPGYFLRRPFSLADWGEGRLNIIYKVVGAGTKLMSELEPGTELDVLTGLGNGYDVSCSGAAPLLIGGGTGVAPMYGLAKALARVGVRFSCVLGFNTAEEIYFLESFEKLGGRIYVTTADGSCGTRGFVTEGMRQVDGYTYTYACGPEPMLRAVYDAAATDGQYSFEARMGCGYGACMGCSKKTRDGYKRVCRDGPVLFREEIIW